MSPEPVAHLSQHRLLPLLLSSTSAPEASVCDSVRFGQHVSAVTQSGSSVQITVSDMQVTTHSYACHFVCLITASIPQQLCICALGA